MEKENVRVLVPEDKIARVIGKAGNSLKQIREVSGAKVQVPPREEGDTSDANTRRVELAGFLDEVATSFGLVISKAFMDEDTCTISLLIPSEKAGIAVGKGGENLRKVRQETRVRVSLERQPVVEGANQLRLITMDGDVSNMGPALRLVLGGQSIPAYHPLMGFQAPALLGGSTGLTQIRPASEDPNEIQLHLTVPDRFAGAILGKGGEKVKQTSATAGCKVYMTTRERQSDRRAVLIGNYQSCATAQKLIREQLEEASAAEKQSGGGDDLGEVQVNFLVRREAAGVVIGKQGATMKNIREQCSARISLNRDEVSGYRPCLITGSLQNVLQAEQLIYDLVKTIDVDPASSAGASPGYGGYGGGGYEDYSNVLGLKRAGETEEITKMLVPSICAGTVIGKQGSGLKGIRERCGVQIDMLQVASAPQWPTDRVVTLKGHLAARQAAADAVLRSVARVQESEPASFKVLIPSSQAGSVIGKQGATLRSIREQSGINVQVERDETMGERLITASGPLAQVSVAASTILQVLDSNGVLPPQGIQPAWRKDRPFQASAGAPAGLVPHYAGYNVGAPQWY